MKNDSRNGLTRFEYWIMIHGEHPIIDAPLKWLFPYSWPKYRRGLAVVYDAEFFRRRDP